MDISSYKKSQSMAGKRIMSDNNMRVGKSYSLTNYGETTDFMVVETTGREDFKIKDLFTMELSQYNDLIKYGRGQDFELFEL